MRIAFRNEYVQALPEGHRFPMEKYDLLPRQLIHEGTISREQLFEPEIIEDAHVLDVHSSLYYERLTSLMLSAREQRVSGFPHDQKLIQRERMIMEGTRKCVEYALEDGISMNIAGGTHHAFYDRGEGFCLLNDQAIAAKWFLKEYPEKKVLIVDLDVHQGNGTASIFETDQRVFTFSMHGRNNYPLKKEHSDLDIELEDGTDDDTYLYQLAHSLDSILSGFTPDLVFYQCGVDVIGSDKLGKLGLTIQGCKMRDRMVFETARTLSVPVVCSMGGGYSRDIRDIIEAHANTFREAQFILT
jgi:acetoin utilization deacetylase AcuC-like enzyme